jgi:hypothetical protein
MSQGEVAQLRQHIEQELQAMRQGLSGLAVGGARHQFIQAKMHQIGTYEEQLATHIGHEQAVIFSCQTYITVMQNEESEDARTMIEQIPPTQQEIEAKITMMNQAEYDYDHAPDGDAKNKADGIFSGCWDWLNEHHITFYRDIDNKVYKLGSKPM